MQSVLVQAVGLPFNSRNIILLVIIFVLMELIYSIFQAVRFYKSYRLELSLITKISGLIKGLNEENIDLLDSLWLEYNSVKYLYERINAAQHVYSAEFIGLLSRGTKIAVHRMNTALNLLPIIGLIGTFLGIVIGTFGIDSNLQSGGDATEMIKPLIVAASLAFISSFVALSSAAILKLWSRVLIERLEMVVDSAEENLINVFIPRLSPQNTEDRFAKSVKNLSRAVNGFVDKFETSFKNFLEDFKPLIVEQRQNNMVVLESITKVGCHLDQNTQVLSYVAEKQEQQLTTMQTAVVSIGSASETLQKSMRLASQTLDNFVNLGQEMKNQIAEMHIPLQSIITNQAEISIKNYDIIENIKSLFEVYREIPGYTKTIQAYMNSLNDKLDRIASLDKDVGDVKITLDNFIKTINTTLEQYVKNSEKFRELMENNFMDYDRNLRSLFTDMTKDTGKVDLFYYDPQVIKELRSISQGNQILVEKLSTQIRNLCDTMDKIDNYINRPKFPKSLFGHKPLGRKTHE